MNCLYDVSVSAIGLKSFTVGFLFFSIILVIDDFHDVGLCSFVSSLLKQFVRTCIHCSLLINTLYSSGFRPSGPGAFFPFSFCKHLLTLLVVMTGLFMGVMEFFTVIAMSICSLNCTGNWCTPLCIRWYLCSLSLLYSSF